MSSRVPIRLHPVTLCPNRTKAGRPSIGEPSDELASFHFFKNHRTLFTMLGRVYAVASSAFCRGAMKEELLHVGGSEEEAVVEVPVESVVVSASVSRRVGWRCIGGRFWKCGLEGLGSFGVKVKVSCVTRRSFWRTHLSRRCE
jgi:hypothetical protein